MKKDAAKDEYVHRNHAIYLSWPNRGTEQGGLLDDERWTEVRTRVSGALALKMDFDVLGDV